MTNLISFLDEVTRRLDAGLKVNVCYIDFSKAFDSVNHSLLAYKLRTFGIVDEAKSWVLEFLHRRRFCVKVGEEVSQYEDVTSGVPQGSVLGPLLFLLFVNDLARELSNPCFVFADDVKITGSNLQLDFERVTSWSKRWDLPLNQGKCQMLTGEVDPNSCDNIGRVSVVRDLGVMVTNDFKPARQCQNAAGKARGELFRMCSTLASRKAEVFMPLYRTIVRPHLEYCVQAWGPFYKKDRDCLEKVQKLATRMVAGMRGKPYKQRLDELNLYSLERRRLRGDLIETFKIVKGISGLKFEDFFVKLPQTGTRGHSLRLQRGHSRLEIRAQFFTNRVVPWWNRLPEDVVACSTIATFKYRLDKCWSGAFPELL